VEKESKTFSGIRDGATNLGRRMALPLGLDKGHRGGANKEFCWLGRGSRKISLGRGDGKNCGTEGDMVDRY